MCSFITFCRASCVSRYQSVLLVNGYTMRYPERSPSNRDCSCDVGRLTYCDGLMIPRKLWRDVIHAPMPERNTAALFCSRASSDGARLQSRTSTPALSPIVE